MSELNLSELMDMDAEAEMPQDVSLKTGVNVGDVPKLSMKADETRPNVTRWVFNPFAVVDLTNESAAFSVPFLNNVIFNKIESIPTRTQSHKPFDFNLTVGPSGDGAEYTKIDRTAYQQAGDIIDKHGEKGVVILSDLFDYSEEDAAELNTLLFGSEIPCKVDLNNERFPCPVLPNLLEVLQTNANEAIGIARRQGQGKDADTIKSVAEEVRSAIGTAIKYARASIADAHNRFLDEKNPNRKFSPAEERCFIALGEEIPNQLPFITKSQAASAGQGIDSEALGRGIAAGLADAGLSQPVIPPVTPGAAAEKAVENVSFEVTDADLESAKAPKKGRQK